MRNNQVHHRVEMTVKHATVDAQNAETFLEKAVRRCGWNGRKVGSLIGGSGSGHASVPRSRASTNPVATRSNASSEISFGSCSRCSTVVHRRSGLNSNVKFDVQVLNQFLYRLRMGPR